MADYRDDIDKYLKGELTAAQMHALEKKALDDPFLADALEGVQSLSPEELRADLGNLQVAVARQVQKKNALWPWVGRIAAGLLLLAVSTIIIISISDRDGKNANDNLALNKENKLAPVAPQEEEEILADSTPATEPASAQAPVREESKNKTAEPLKRSSKPQTQPDQRIADIPTENSTAGAAEKDEEQEALAEPDISQSVQTEEKIATTLEDSAPSTVQLDAEKKRQGDKDDARAKSAKEKAAPGAPLQGRSNSYSVGKKIIHGKVTFSDDGTGLAGVNVLIKGSNMGTVTDEKGNYQIPVSDDQPTLQFSFIGFTNRDVEASSEEVDVQLEADASELTEVVVVGYGSKDPGFLPSTPSVMELATPEGGRKVFKQYLEKNLKYPQEAIKNQVEGKVTVQFTIGMSGQLTDFRVIRGIGYGCDEEVIRLIKAGPKWTPTKSDEAPIQDRARVRMRFALPKK